jgi:uncharacterized membrane protein YheB (UPF0754 family)
MVTSLWVLPLVAAAIGWFTNFVAVRMIFRPHRPVSLLGLKIQGLLPKRRREFAASIGATVAEHLLSADDIKRVLTDPAVKARMTEVLEERIDTFFGEKLIAAVPMLAAFMKGPLLDKIKSTLSQEMQDLMESQAVVVGESLDATLDFHAIVEQKILDFDLAQLEQIVLRVARTELRWIEVLGALLGFIVGLVQLLILHFSGV